MTALTLLVASFCSHIVAGDHAPMLDPSLVVTRYTELEGRLASVRGVRIGPEDIHVDVYFEGAATASDIPEYAYGALLEAVGSKLAPWSDIEGVSATEGLAAPSGFPAAHCQVDEQLSIAVEIRSGRFLQNMLELLYAQPAPDSWTWTRRAINVGAGEEPTDDDDPLGLWAGAHAAKAWLLDMSAFRLMMAENHIRAFAAAAASQSPSGVRPGGGLGPELVHIVGKTTPEMIAHGALGDRLARETDGRVDVLKIDIDGFDCSVLQALLGRVEATILILEVQPAVPPPIRFARLYHPNDPFKAGWSGCSLSYQAHLLGPQYDLLLYTEDSTVFALASLRPLLESQPPGAVFYWTTYSPQLPADERDCFRRARTASLEHITAAASRPTPIEFVREWALRLQPLDALHRIWGNLSLQVLAQARSLDSGAGLPLFALDL